MRIFLFFLMSFLFLLTACTPQQSKRERIVTVTVLPQQYFAEQIAGDKFTINCMVPRGSSPESYDPTPAELMKLSKSMIYFKIGYMGFELAWMDKIISMNPDMVISDTSDGIDLIRGSHDCTEHDAHHDHHHTEGIDPHIWSSPSSARIIATNMLNTFVAVDGENETYYRNNYARLVMEIDSLDTRIRSMLLSVESKSFAIYHPALAYFARDYGLEQISFEHEGKEPSVQHLAQLTQALREKSIRVVFVQQEFDQKNGELLAKEGKCRLIKINPLNPDWRSELLFVASSLAEKDD